jgi:hypothetical protein
MRRLAKEKRNQLAGILLATLAVIAGLYSSLIKAQKARLAVTAPQIEKAKRELEKMRHTIQSAAQVKADLKAASANLAGVEAGMVTGDPYAWLYSQIKAFQQNYKVDIPQFSSVELGEMTLLPKFPYKQAKIGIGGSAFFYGLGTFLADFENAHPYMRVQNVVIAQGGGQSTGTVEEEKLTFRLEIVALVKPGSG